MKYKMNNFYYINTLKRKRNDQLSNNENNIKRYADVRIRSPVAWVQNTYAMHCDTMFILSPYLHIAVLIDLSNVLI